MQSSHGKSEGAKRIKLADKTANLTALVESPPLEWDLARRRADVGRVIAGCRGGDPVLAGTFDVVVARVRSALAAEALA